MTIGFAQVSAKGGHVKPRIAILLGDPAGIGPELVARLLSTTNVGRGAQVVVIGDTVALDEGQRVAGVHVALRRISDIDEMTPGDHVAFLHVPAVESRSGELRAGSALRPEPMLWLRSGPPCDWRAPANWTAYCLPH